MKADFKKRRLVDEYREGQIDIVSSVLEVKTEKVGSRVNDKRMSQWFE